MSTISVSHLKDRFFGHKNRSYVHLYWKLVNIESGSYRIAADDSWKSSLNIDWSDQITLHIKSHTLLCHRCGLTKADSFTKIRCAVSVKQHIGFCSVFHLEGVITLVFRGLLCLERTFVDQAKPCTSILINKQIHFLVNQQWTWCVCILHMSRHKSFVNRVT